MNEVINSMMTFIMSHLVNLFGFIVAVRIKDSLDILAGGVFFGIVVLWIAINAFIHLERYKDLDEDVAIMVIERDGITVYWVNPHTIGEGVEVIIGYYILKIFPYRRLYYKRLRHISTILYIIGLIVIVFGLLIANWVTPESFEKYYRYK